MESLHQRLDSQAMMVDLADLGVENRQYDPYEKKSQNIRAFPILDEELEVSKVGAQHLIAEIILLRGDKISRDQVVCQKFDAHGFQIGRSNQNPILDTYLYEVVFLWVK